MKTTDILKRAAYKGMLKEAVSPLGGAAIGAGITGTLTLASQGGKIHSGEDGMRRINPYRLGRNMLAGAALGAGGTGAYKNRAAIAEKAKTIFGNGQVKRMMNNVEGATEHARGATEEFHRAATEAADTVKKVRKNRAFGLFAKG